MVFPGEGLRSPRIGPSLSSGPPAVNPGRAAAAMAAAGVIGASGGAAMAQEGYTPQNGYNPSANTRTASAPSTSANANPLFNGVNGSKAPSLSGPNLSMPSVPRNLPSAGSGMPSTMPPTMRGGNLGGALGGLLLEGANRGASNFGDKNAKGDDPISKARRFFGRNAEQEARKQADYERARDDFYRNLGQKIADKFNNWRKGDKQPQKFKPPRGEPQKLNPAKSYYVYWTQTDKVGDETLPPVPHINGVSGSAAANLTHSKEEVYLNDLPVSNTRGTPNEIISATIDSITELNGEKVPFPDVPPFPSEPGEFPEQLGLIPIPDVPNAPALPPAKPKPPTPTNNNSPPPTSPTDTRPDNPSKAPQGEPNRSPPTATNGQGAPTLSSPSPKLPSIPGAPSTGSATAPRPLFPSPFTQTPGQRNEDALKKREEPPGEPPRKQGCSDPCIATLQNALPPLADSLDGLDVLIGELLARQQQQQQQQEEQQQEEEERSELITINVPVCSCNEDGTATMQNVPIQVLSSQQAVTTAQFTALAAVQAAQCKIQRHTERSHNILGGDVWFDAADSRSPAFKTRIERKVKEAGTLFGFPAIAAETGTPSTVGQVTAANIIELINAYTSNLYHRAGFHGFPAEVPKTLLGYTDEESPETIKDLSSYFVWFVQQFDALVGKFPIEIEIEDADPTQKGQQKKTLELPNISEALAEMYGLNFSGVSNSAITVNMLARIAVETVAAKNAALIGQDYAKANASFLGYKGNTVKREIEYAFNPKKFDTLDEFLANTKVEIDGWEEQDPETVVGFLQRIVFSAGIIKAVFFRDKKRLKELANEVESLLSKDKESDEAAWLKFIQLINNPDSHFNKGDNPQPKADKETNTDAKS